MLLSDFSQLLCNSQRTEFLAVFLGRWSYWFSTITPHWHLFTNEDPQFCLINKLFYSNQNPCEFLTPVIKSNCNFPELPSVELTVAQCSSEGNRSIARSLQLSKITLEIGTRCFVINEERYLFLSRLKAISGKGHWYLIFKLILLFRSFKLCDHLHFFAFSVNFLVKSNESGHLCY